jgi:hypothetical protein
MPSSLFQVLPGFSAGNKLSIIDSDSHACLKKRDRGSDLWFCAERKATISMLDSGNIVACMVVVCMS